VEEPAQVHAERGVVILLRVVEKRLGDEDAGVVHERIHAPVRVGRRADDGVGDRRVGDVARNRADEAVLGCGNRARVRDDRIAMPPVRLDQSSSDALRSAGDHGDFACVHMLHVLY
jgi:hypothetical protein